jgi:fructokinase
MKHIYCLGETVYDIIFKDGQPVAAKAGGSMLNSTVSLGRLGLPVSFISEYANDQIGTNIDNFLKSSGVNTSYVYRYSDGKSSIAIAFLDKKNDALYSFYKQMPQQRLNIRFPTINKDDIVLFGSFYALNKEIRETVVSFISEAKKAGAIIIYDPNFRKAHLYELSDLLPYIIENMQMATIVRGSNEDFQMIFNANTLGESYKFMSKYCSFLIYTQNAEGVMFKSTDNELFIKTPVIEPVSTIGAGDNFNAGLIYGLYKNDVQLQDIAGIQPSLWNELIQHGIKLASEVCLSYDNYISSGFAWSYKSNP